QFLLDHVGCLATEAFQTERALDVTKVQFHVPTLSEQLAQLAFRRLARIEERRDQHLLPDLHLAHRDLIWIVAIVLYAHPFRPMRLCPAHPMIAYAKPFAATKV